VTASQRSDERRAAAPLDGGPSVERQLAAAQAIAHLGSWEWDAATNRVIWSDELYRIYGLEPQSCDITFASFLGRLHPGDRERVQREVGDALASGNAFSYPERILRPDGSVRYIETAGEPQRDGTGRVTGLIGTCRDVTDQRERDQSLALKTDIVEKIQIGIAVWCIEDGSVDPRLVTWNPAAGRLARLDLAPMIGKSLREILPFAAGGKLESLIREVATDGKDREAIVEGSRDPEFPTRSISFKAFSLPDRCVGIAVEDITALTLAKWMAGAEQRIFEMIAEGAPLTEILSRLAAAIEEQSPTTLASVMLLDDDGEHIHVGAAPRLPESYCRALEGLPIGPKAGSCGTAAFLRKAVVVTDIETDALWEDYRTLAREASLRACWSTPIFAIDGRVLGTFALYYAAPRSPRPEDFIRVARATHIASIAIERRQMEDELRALSGHLQTIREEERTGIAREIHDDLGQSLTALKMDLAWIARRSRASELDEKALAEKATEMASAVDSIIDRVRRISSELRPGILDDLGLVPALEWQAQEFQRRCSITCLVAARVPPDVTFSQAVSTAVFRIFQEALTNVARHGEATSVDVRLDVVRGEVLLEVEDDGRGIDTLAINSRESLGLVGIRERARQLGGDAMVSRGPSRGTLVSVRIPLGAAR
jgi:PAS domain S-box-containing protein